jgi:hypothetical protein
MADTGEGREKGRGPCQALPAATLLVMSRQSASPPPPPRAVLPCLAVRCRCRNRESICH